MNIEVYETYEAISIRAKDIIVSNLQEHKGLTLCAATGGSPTKLYELLRKEYLLRQELFTEFNVIKLDEWGGIPMEQKGTCEEYLRRNLINPLNISDERYISFQSNPKDPINECVRIQNKIDKIGAIDVCILGIGTNGHIALNEPQDFLNPYCHVTELSNTTLMHPMISEEKDKPTYGMTLGMAEILKSKQIVLLISGINKKNITEKFLSKKITTKLPASFLWLHPNVFCLITKDAV